MPTPLPAARTPWWHLLVVLAACAAVYWPFLGSNGFGASEGHRVGPAWEMLETGDWVHLKLFGQTYLRKPPGMPWAIALSSSALGQTEFAARAVSALACTLMALIAFGWTNRWLGAPWGLAGGLVQAVGPVFITIGRTAEIDPLNCLGTQLAAFGLVSLLRPGPEGRKALMDRAPVWVAVGVVIAGMAKGPASLPVLLGILGAACLLARSGRVLLDGAVWKGLVGGGMVLAALGAWFVEANRDPNAVVQDFSEFTWSWTRIQGTLLLPVTAFLAAAPASAALVVLWFHQRVEENRRTDATLGVANLLALAWVVSVLVLMVSGSSNPRYAMPAAVLLGPLGAWGLRACWNARAVSVGGRLLMLGHPVVPGVVLLGLYIWWLSMDLGRVRHDEGRLAGEAIAVSLPDGAVVWANDMVEARPDVLLYAKQAAARAGRELQARWGKRALSDGEFPVGGEFMLLRDDAESGEAKRYFGSRGTTGLRVVSEGRVAKYGWVLVRVLGPVRSPGEAGGSNVQPAAEPAASEETGA